MRRSLLAWAAICALLATSVVATSSTAAAADDLTTLSTLVPHVSRAKLTDAVRYVAKKRKLSYTKALKSLISMLTSKKATNSRKRSTGSMGGVGVDAGPASDSGGGGTPAMAPRWVGDIFVTTNGLTVGERNFGHTGLYTSPSQILHAPGWQHRAQVQPRANVLVGPGTKYMTTPLSIQRQVEVAQWARNKYEGQFYNPLAFTNKVPNGLSFGGTTLNSSLLVNCSELVWGAYKFKGGLDLDGETLNTAEFFAVFPWDIEKDTQTYNYTP